MDGMLSAIPLAVAFLLLGLVAIFVLKRPLIDLLKRVEKVKAGEVAVEWSQTDQQLSAKKGGVITGSGQLASEPAIFDSTGSVIASLPNSVEHTSRGEILKNYGVSPLIVERDYLIRKDMQNVTESERESVLVRHLATTQLLLEAEQVYRLIFGSQLGALNYLNLYGAKKTSDVIAAFYDPATKEFPAVYEKISHEDWFHYLFTSNLIENLADGACQITPRGKAFLEWIVASGILPSKPF